MPRIESTRGGRERVIPSFSVASANITSDSDIREHLNLHISYVQPTEYGIVHTRKN